MCAAVLFLASGSAARQLSQAPTGTAQIPLMNPPVTETGPVAATGPIAAPTTSSAAEYPTFQAAVEAANSTTADLSTLLQAVKVAGAASSLNSSTTWTVLVGASDSAIWEQTMNMCLLALVLS